MSENEILFQVIPANAAKPVMYKDRDGSWWAVREEVDATMLPPEDAVAPKYKRGEHPCRVVHRESTWYCTRVQGHDRDWHVAHTANGRTLAKWRADL